MENKIQMLVGPTALPERVKNAMVHPAFSHRSKYYEKLQIEVFAGIQTVLKTKNELLIYSSSGTGIIEGVIQNLFNEGDKIIIPSNGEFGKLLYNVAKPYGLDITFLEYPYSEEVDIDEVLSHVEEDTKAVLMVHNESSTGVMNNIKKLGLGLKNTNTLAIVDCVSSAGGINIEMDNWNLDVAFTTTQKALMSPPGVAFVALSEMAWKRVKEVINDTYYFNFQRDREYANRNISIHTIATHTMLALREALSMIQEEGIENVLDRHANNAQILRDGLREIGFELLAKNDQYASNTLTAVQIPNEAEYYTKELNDKYNIEVGGGINHMVHDYFRIGTMGYVFEEEVNLTLAALKEIVNNKVSAGSKAY